MNVLGQLLDARDDDHRADAASRGRSGRDEEREAAFRIWVDGGRRPEERVLKFDQWLRRELATRLDWTWAGAHREKRIEQCRIHLEGVVLRLWERGWMLDGRRLATHLQTLLDAVATYQKKGAIQDFWAYFKSSCERYVGGNAEELREEAMHAGSHVNQLLAAITRTAQAPKIGDLLQQRREETLRERLAKERARQVRAAAGAAQRRLF